MSSVSILTVSQGSRVGFLKLQAQNISNQKHPNILEWVIVDGSSDAQGSDLLSRSIPSCSVPTRLVRAPHGTRIGGLRNIGNGACRGDIIVCMDDDDYYMPDYVGQAVDALAGHDVAGCARIYVYDARWKLLVQANPAVRNHTTNCCLAYRRSYADGHSYDSTVSYDEESSFLGMPENSLRAGVHISQMDPTRAMVHMVHSSNTSEKSRAILSALYNKPYCCARTDLVVDDLVPSSILDVYAGMIGDKKQCPYDIVYVCGLWSIDWDPMDESLGGSEQAVVNLSRQWAAAGKRVAVYGEVPRCTHNGVDYFPFSHFDPWQRFDTLILWRYHGIVPFQHCIRGVSARNIFIDFHDNMIEHFAPAKEMVQSDPRVRLFFKSRFHYDQFVERTGIDSSLVDRRHAIIMNGIQVDAFRSPRITPGPRQQFRICYASCYVRGLELMLRHFWPIVLSLEPRAELHLYYGIGPLVMKEHAISIRDAISSSLNVCDHGRCSIHMVSREKHMSNVHLYLTEVIAEIDCISVRESLVAGCIPFILDMGVFRERDGVRVPKGTTFQQSAEMLVALMRDNKRCEELRQRFYGSPTITSWRDAARDWLAQM